MKKIISLTLFAIFFSCTYAQQSFEGTITYQLIAEDKPDGMSLKVSFGKTKMLVNVLPKGNEAASEMEDLLFNFEKNELFYLNTVQNTFRKVKLKNEKNSLPQLTASNHQRVIAGILCSQFKNNNAASSKGMWIDCWYADSLYYAVDQSYRNYEMIPIFSNGEKVCLAFEIRTDSSAERKPMFKTTAISINREKLSDSVFLIPSEMTKESSLPAKDSVAYSADSTIQMLEDSARKLIDEAATKVKNSAEATAGKKTKGKGAATHKKLPTKSPAAKPKE